MLGAFARTTKIVSENTVETVIRKTFGEKKAELVDVNLKAFQFWQP